MTAMASRTKLATLSLLASILIASPQTNADEPPVFIIVGVDRTAGWNEMTRDALRVAETLVKDARPGDIMEFRWISEASWPPQNHIGTFRFPPYTVPNSHGKQINPRIRVLRNKLHQQYLRKLAEEVNSMYDFLWASCKAETRSTDIGGFIEAASDRFQQYPARARRKIVIMSDFEERMAFPVTPNLSTVSVTIVPLRQSANPAEAKEKLDNWLFWLQEATNVSDVEIRRPVELPPARRECQ